MNETKRVSDLFLGYLSRHPYAAAVADYEAVRARANLDLTGPGYLDRLTDLVRAAIAGRRPFAAVRIGDGEGNLLAASVAEEAELREWALGRIMMNMVGRDDIGRGGIGRLAALMRAAILEADVVGVRSPELLERTYRVVKERRDEDRKVKNVRGLLGNLDSVRMIRRLLEGGGGRLAGITEFQFNVDLLPHYADLLGGLDYLGVICRSAALGPALERAFGVKRCEVHVVPAQAKGEFRSDHFPEVFDRLSQTLEPPYPGAVFLVGAGVFGKPYCAMLKRKGAVAIDLGSVVDIWLGAASRSNMTDEMMGRWRLPA